MIFYTLFKDNKKTLIDIQSRAPFFRLSIIDSIQEHSDFSARSGFQWLQQAAAALNQFLVEQLGDTLLGVGGDLLMIRKARKPSRNNFTSLAALSSLVANILPGNVTVPSSERICVVLLALPLLIADDEITAWYACSPGTGVASSVLGAFVVLGPGLGPGPGPGSGSATTGVLNVTSGPMLQFPAASLASTR
ncbi:hypothetical protein [Paenibacillus oryzisoli]|uniref:Uncharacterized protein n=1 Tax=Paenibacillus oryzisoli TaxID=1850517 RepID=A0A198AKY8_9BACL|nr:hypothetical protein [Paenibacillus oryzisoli]OAS21897.1 hypothetical protein A8708_07130 [Paenibacillus oryzisoli]